MSKESALAMIPTVTTTPAVAQTAETSNPGLTPAEAPKDERFEALAKKEGALVRERQALSAEKASIQAEKAKMESLQGKLTQFEDMRIKDPVAAIKGLGFTENDIFNFLAQAEQPQDPVKAATEAAQAEIAKFREDQAKELSVQQQQRHTQVLTKFRSDIKETISADPDTYEYLNHRGEEAEALVYEEVAAELNTSGKIITIAEAAARVEAAYEEDDKAMNGLKKRSGAVERPKAEPVVQIKPEVSPRPAQGQTRTLSNKVSTTVSTTVARQETREQKRERLMDALRQGVRK